MNLSQLLSAKILTDKLELLVVILLVIAVFNVILSITLSTKIALIRTETAKIEEQNQELKETNSNLESRTKRIILAIKANKEKLELLEHQMTQVHDWLGRLTISDFLEPEIDSTEVMEALTSRAYWEKKRKEIDKKNE